MTKGKAGNRSYDDQMSSALEKIARGVEDLFILQALLSGVGREAIRKMIGVHTTRISRFNKGVKQALKNGKPKAQR